MKKAFIKPIFLVILAVFALHACSQAEDYSSAENDSAANFTLPTLEGGEVSLADILKEKKAVLFFWTTWCYFCRRELPHVEKFYQQHKEKLAVLGIDVDESKARVERTIQKMQLSFPMLLDVGGKVAEEYDLRGVPTIIVVDQDRRILYFGHSIDEMAAAVEF